jgi:outer membrane protein TolC
MITQDPKTNRGKRMKGMGLAIALLVSGAGTLPAEPGQLSLEDAIGDALHNSPRLLAAQAEDRAARDAAQGAGWGRFPSVTGEIGWVRSDHPVQVFSSLLAQERFGPENFGRFDPSSGTFDLSTLNTPDPESNVRAAVTVFQPIWTGGAVQSGIHAARATATAAHENALRGSQSIRFETEKAFRYAILSDKKVEVLRGSLAVAEAQAARIESLWTEGLALQSDRRALQAHVSEMSADLENALADSAEARSGLGLLMGAGGPVIASLMEPPEETGFSAPPDSAAIATALARADVRAAQASANAAASAQGLARAEFLPTVGLMGVAEHNSDTFFGAGGDQWTIGVTARWHFDLGSPQRTQAAGGHAVAARKAYEGARDQAIHEVRTALDRLRAAERRKVALDAAVAFSDESYRLIEARYHEGLASALELSEYQNTLVRTRLGAAAAAQELALARASVLLAAGTLGGAEEATP